MAVKNPSKETVLCTGGLGFIGSHTVIQLEEEGYDVVILDNLVASSTIVHDRLCSILQKKIPFYEADLTDVEALRKVFKASKIDLVVHFAGLKAVGDSTERPLEYYHNNVTGTINLLQVMQEVGCKKMIFSSSAAVYKAKEEVLVEKDLTLPSNPYGNTKLMIEHILKDLYNSDTSWFITNLRYFNPIGAHDSGLIGDASKHPTNLLPVIQLVSKNLQPTLLVFGNDWETRDGTGIRDYIHIEDLAEGHVVATKSLLGKAKASSVGECVVYNLGTGRGTSVLEMVSLYEEISGLKIPFKYASRRPGDGAIVVADPSKANKELGWFAKRSMREACISAFKWREQNPNGYV